MTTFGQAVKALELTWPGTDERVTAKALLEVLKEDVILAVERPGSWEGANMHQVLRCHGFWLKEPD
jgi:hypothetical protein